MLEHDAEAVAGAIRDAEEEQASELTDRPPVAIWRYQSMERRRARERIAHVLADLADHGIGHALAHQTAIRPQRREHHTVLHDRRGVTGNLQEVLGFLRVQHLRRVRSTVGAILEEKEVVEMEQVIGSLV